jgi:HAD superfamily hydrolase (TIGR01509 family)
MLSELRNRDTRRVRDTGMTQENHSHAAGSANPVDLVIFDCDGVLVDSELLGAEADVLCLADEGFVITVQESLDRYSGMSVADMVRDQQIRCGRPGSLDVAKFERKHQRLMSRLIAKNLQMIPGISEALDAIACRMCVASSGPKSRICSSLKTAGLFERFHPHIFSAGMVARGKPFPDLFLHAAARMRVEPKSCVVVEDSVPGVTAAVAADMRVIGFAGGSHCRTGHASRLYAAGADCVIDRMSELLPAVAAGRKQ